MRIITTLLTIALSVLFFTTSATAAKVPTKYITDFHFRPTTSNQLTCPAAHESTFTGPLGGKWGILCGWDTKTTSYRWGPIKGISFQQCILQCGKLEGCTVASYDGTCYLRTSAKNKGYVGKGDQRFRVAVKLN